MHLLRFYIHRHLEPRTDLLNSTKTVGEENEKGRENGVGGYGNPLV
jgi:hypothetical protein